MSRLSSNKLLPLLAVVVLSGLALVAGKSVLSNNRVASEPRTTLPTPGALPDGDTPVDTIRTLRAELTASRKQMAEVIAQNQDLAKTNKTLLDGEARVEARLADQLEEKLAAAKLEQEDSWSRNFDKMGTEFASLKSSLTVAEAPSAAPVLGDETDYPVGGLEVGGEDYVWIEPLDAGSSPALSLEAGETDASSLLNDGFRPEGAPEPLLGSDEPAALQAVQAAAPEPYFTINNLATLAGSTAFTAMIGRVPINGEVADPVPFRVLVGRENLAASGLRVPDEIVSMVFEGVGIGDWTLGCVEGSLRTATFIFEDGTIRTVKGDESQGGRLGYIADKFGTPCVVGERVSNAMNYLAAQVGLAAGAGAAEGLAAAQTAQVIEGGAISSAVVGDIGQFAIGRAASDATAEVQQYLADRLSSTFDAIYVPPGQKISLLIQKEIAIDYDPKGRRLDHAKGDVPRNRSLD